VTDSGSIVIGWLSKLAIGFALFGLIAYDGFTILTANFGASDDATTAANSAADAYKATHDLQSAYNAAVQSVAGKGDTIETRTFTIAQDGTVTLTVDRTPHTMWMQYLGPLKSWTEVKQTGSGTPGG